MSSFTSFAKRIYGFAGIIPVIAVALAMLAAPAAHAWGCQGHETVALIAEMHLNPHALAKVNKLLTDYPRDPALNKYCKETGLDAMADAGPWADDYRSVHPETEGWHFIDIAGDATRKTLRRTVLRKWVVCRRLCKHSGKFCGGSTALSSSAPKRFDS